MQLLIWVTSAEGRLLLSLSLEPKLFKIIKGLSIRSCKLLNNINLTLKFASTYLNQVLEYIISIKRYKTRSSKSQVKALTDPQPSKDKEQLK